MRSRHAAAVSACVLVVLGVLALGWSWGPAGHTPPTPVTQPPVPLAHVAASASPTEGGATPVPAPPAPDAPRPGRLLAIGNSFATGAIAEYLSPLARAGGHDLSIGIAWIGGAPLDLHAANAASGAGAYTYLHVDATGVRRDSSGISLDQALTAEDWDVVTIQQASPLSGRPDALEPALSTLVSHIRERLPGARILVHQTWAYAWGTGSSGFATYGRDQCRMYAELVETYDLAVSHVGDSGLVPTGTTLQVARAHGVAEADLTVGDGMHLKAPHGQFLAALTWYESLYGEPAPPTFTPDGVTIPAARSLREAAHAAVDWRDGVRFVVPCREPA